MSFSIVSQPLSVIEPLEPDFLPPLPPVSGMPHGGISREELERQIFDHTAVAVASALASQEARVQNAIRTAQETTQKALSEMRTLAAPRVMGVRVNGGPVKKLSKEAHPDLPEILVVLKAVRPNVLLCGPRGSGKTTLAAQVAESLGLPFASLTVTAGASETWLLGRTMAGSYQSAPFCDLYEKGGVFLLDEIDAADPNWALTLNTALENGHFTNPISGRTLTRHPDFFVVACSNTNMRGGDMKYTGRSRQDAALVERFFPMGIEYNEELEKRLVDSELCAILHDARSALAASKSPEEISMRGMITLERALVTGLTVKRALAALQLGWSQSAVNAVNLESKLEAFIASKKAT